MKDKTLKRIVAAAKIIFCLVLVYFLAKFLISWNEVLHFKNFVYLSHPMSKDAYSNMHHTTLDAEITFTNDGTGVSKERYSFSIDKQLKDSAVSRPQIMTVDTLAALMCPSVNNNYKVPLGVDLLRKAEKNNGGMTSNAFGVIRFSTPSVNQRKYNDVELYKGGNQNSYVIHKNNILGYADTDFWYEEDRFFDLLNSLREWDLTETSTSLFRFDDDDLLVNTYYGIGRDADGAVVIESKDIPFQKLRRFFSLFFASYDISQAEYDCSFIAHELDSTIIRFKFAEGVEISKVHHPGLIENNTLSNGLVFVNLGKHTPKGFSEIFNDHFNDQTTTIDIDGWQMRDFKENKSLRFHAKYLDSRNIQWIRLFFLTTIIAYVLTLIWKYFIQFCKGK